MKLSIAQLQESQNIVELLDEDVLYSVGSTVIKGFELDEDSRSEWKGTVDKAMAIAKQVIEPKSFPWPGASNIKFPLITQASIDYASRTMPEIIQSDKVVKASITGMDKDSLKYARASRVSQYMSYQLVTESPDWEDGTDKLLQILPVLGTVFKKTYYNSIEKRCMSELCVPDKIVVNYASQSLETARRITHILTMYTNDIVERQRRGIFNADVSPETLKSVEDSSTEDEDFPITLLEQHCYLDLDDDGYKEPYIVTVHKDSGAVLRIVSRFKTIEKDKTGKIQRITPEQYFTDFHFIRSPDGGFYSMGFGSLLLPVNNAINTLINQLIDAGTLSNTQGGFLGRGLRIKNGEFKVRMGEWKVLDTASGTDIGQNVFPLPVREPSQTLFSLLGLLMQVGKDLSSTTDVLSGKQSAQNVSSNTISQLVEQGTKVFTAINKRVYRSLKKEYQKIYELNSEYLTQKKYSSVLDDPEADVKADFELNTLDIHPVADPSVSSESQRVMRAGAVQSLRTADPRQADMLLLESMQFDKSTIDKLLPPVDPQAPPPPEQQKIMAEAQKLQAEVALMSANATLDAEKNQMEMAKIMAANQMTDAQIQESMARVWKMQQDVINTQQKLMIASAKMQQQEGMKVKSTDHKIVMDHAKLVAQSNVDQASLIIKNKEADIKADKVKVDASKLVIESQGKPIPKSTDYSEDDIQYTARIKGLHPELVRAIVGAK